MGIALLTIVFLLGFVTMFFGAISGGVGLVTRPVLVFLGFPASSVISSSRVASLAGEWPGLYLLHKKKHVDWKIASFLIIPMVIGSVLASFAVITILKSNISRVLGILLFIAGLFFLFKKNIGTKEKKQQFSKIKTNLISYAGTIPISFLGTITGGLGPVYSFFYIWLYGKSFISASAIWRIASNISTLFSAIIFIVSGTVDWQLCIPLMLGLMLGSYFGTHYGLKKGERWVRYIILIVTFAGAIKLMFF